MPLCKGLHSLCFCYRFLKGDQSYWLSNCSRSYSKKTQQFNSCWTCDVRLNIWSLSKHCEHLKSLCRILYPGEDLHFLSWVSGDWQEVERNVKRSTESWWNNEKTETWLMDQLASVIFKSFGNCFSWYDPLQLIIGVIFPFGRISARRSLSKRPSDSETVRGSRL